MNDIIVVGAGTAGCVLAERLTSFGKLRVMLIEAGGKPSSPFVKIPAGFAKLFKTKLDWAFESEPQTATKRRGSHDCVPRGGFDRRQSHGVNRACGRNVDEQQEPNLVVAALFA